MLPQKSTILVAVMTMATLLSLGSLSLMPFDVYASHSYEAGVQGDNIPDNTHIDLSQLNLTSAGVFPLYDSSPNFVSGHFLYKGPCEDGDEDNDGTPFEPIVSVIAGHIDESANLTHVDFVPLYYVGHASPIPGICVYHAHIPDPLEGGSPRVTDIDLVNFSPEPVAFNPGDAVDVNIQRTLGNIGDYYANDTLLPLQLAGGNNKVIDLNEEEHEEAAANNANVQQTLGNLVQFNANDVKLPHESTGENNKVFNFNEQHDNDNDNDEDDNDEDDNDEEEDEDQDHNDE